MLRYVHRGVFRTQSNICDSVFCENNLRLISAFFLNKAPSQMFDWFLNTPVVLGTEYEYLSISISLCIQSEYRKKVCKFMKKTPTQVFSPEYYYIHKSNCFEEHLQNAASVVYYTHHARWCHRKILFCNIYIRSSLSFIFKNENIALINVGLLISQDLRSFVNITCIWQNGKNKSATNEENFSVKRKS